MHKQCYLCNLMLVVFTMQRNYHSHHLLCGSSHSMTVFLQQHLRGIQVPADSCISVTTVMDILQLYRPYMTTCGHVHVGSVEL